MENGLMDWLIYKGFQKDLERLLKYPNLKLTTDALFRKICALRETCRK